MWSFKIGHSTLQVMLMMLMVCSAPVYRAPQPSQRKMILEKIEAEVDKLLEAEWNNIMVVMPLHTYHKFPKNFFCLAEKVAENAMEKNVKTKKLSTLTTEFKQYNALCSTNCTLQKDHRYPLQTFLEEVKACVTYFLHSKRQNNNKNNTDC